MKQSALKRRAPLARGTSTLSRSTPLRSDPARRKRRQSISAKVRRDVYARSNRKCIVCRKRRPLTIHHVLPVREWPALELDARNMVGVCAGCHDEHERAHRRIRWSELPECAITLAYATSGAAAVYLERTYTR